VRARIQALRARDLDTTEWLVREYGPRMLGVARRILGVAADARDVVRDAFETGLRSLDQLGDDSALGDWLRRLVVEAALSRLRPELLRSGIAPDASDPGTADTRSFTPEWNGSKPEIRRRVRECITRLPTRHRIVLILRDIEAFAAEDVARLLNLPRETVDVCLHRARQQLMHRLQEHPPFAG
jgi:RNA polymerase sigma-70 factor (ECF subfamily)